MQNLKDLFPVPNGSKVVIFTPLVGANLTFYSDIYSDKYMFMLIDKSKECITFLMVQNIICHKRSLFQNKG